MPKGLKIVLGIIVVLLALLSIIWGASWVFRLLLSFEGVNLKTLLQSGFNLSDKVQSQPFSIIEYSQHYSQSMPKQIKGAWLLSVIAHAMIIGIVLWLFFGKKKKSLYGDARFATNSEIKKADLFIHVKEVNKEGLFAGTKIIVGRLGSQYIGLGGQLFAYLAAPTRTGKGVGVVVPVGLSYSHSIVVLDIKQELFEITGAFRAKNGHEVYLFNPFDPEGRTACWNPLSYVDRSEHLRVDGINEIAICLIPNSSDESFFEESARKLFIGLALYTLDKELAWKSQGASFTPTIKSILDLATDFNGEAIPYFQSLINDEFVSRIAKQTINSAISSGDKTFASILATLTTNLTPWLSSTVATATSYDDFDLRDVRRKKMSIYIGIQPKDLAKSQKIINLFYSQLINENTSVLPQNDEHLKYQCLLLMDEGTSPGRINILIKAVSYMAGYNLRMLLIVQSPAQLRDQKVYGEHGCDNILTNIALKILFKPSSVKDSEEYSQLLGKTTIKEDTQRSRGGDSKGVSRTETQNQRDLMMPQELRQLSNTKEIIIFEGLSYPIIADKNCYYTDSVFKKRYINAGRLKVKQIKDRSTIIKAKLAINNATEKINVEISKGICEAYEALEKIKINGLADFITDEIVN